MIPQNEHTLYGWFIIIGAVCAATLVGALIDHFLQNRGNKRDRYDHLYYIPQIVKDFSPKHSKIKK